MVEDKKQVVVESVQDVPMSDDERGNKVCGVTPSRKCRLLVGVLILLVIVGVAVG